MDKKLFDELIEALSEDFTKEELYDEPFMEKALKELIGASKEEARHLAKAAREIQLLRPEVKPFWKYLLNVH